MTLTVEPIARIPLPWKGGVAGAGAHITNLCREVTGDKSLHRRGLHATMSWTYSNDRDAYIVRYILETHPGRKKLFVTEEVEAFQAVLAMEMAKHGAV